MGACRAIQPNKVVFAQADLFNDDKTRKVGVGASEVACVVFWDNTILPWPLVDGSGTAAVQVSSGRVFWSELLPGFYNVRFRPNAIGYWRIVITNVAQEVTFDFDILLDGQVAASGLRVAFGK